MVAKYYLAIRPQTNENHAVHKEGCPFLPDNKRRIYLGKFDSGQDAVTEGQRYFSKTNCCLFCSKEFQQKKRQPAFSEIELTKNIPVNNQISLPAKDALYYFLN
jgi:hypothetical protein